MFILNLHRIRWCLNNNKIKKNVIVFANDWMQKLRFLLLIVKGISIVN